MREFQRRCVTCWRTKKWVLLVLVLVCFSSVNCSKLGDNCVAACRSAKITAQSLLKGRGISGTILPHLHSLRPSEFPSWVNVTLVQVGQHFAQKNLGHVLMGHLLALVYDNFLPDTKTTLLASGSTSLKKNAAIRYTATSTQVILWYRNNIENPVERRILLRTLQKIGEFHANASFKIQHRLQDKSFIDFKRKEIFENMRSVPNSIFHDVPFWNAVQRDLTESWIPRENRKYSMQWNYNGIPINQLGQALTQFSFAGLISLFHKQLGIVDVREEELRGFIHLWAFLGHVLGIQEEFNICINNNLEESSKLFRDILQTYYLPSLFQMDQSSHIELSALLDGLYIMSPHLTPKLVMFRFLRDFAQIQPRSTLKTLNFVERMYNAAMDGVLSTNFGLNRWFLNQGGLFEIDVNVYKYFGASNSRDQLKSRNVFYGAWKD